MSLAEFASSIVASDKVVGKLGKLFMIFYVLMVAALLLELPMVGRGRAPNSDGAGGSSVLCLLVRSRKLT
jgi:hypothetical protein